MVVSNYRYLLNPDHVVMLFPFGARINYLISKHVLVKKLWFYYCRDRDRYVQGDYRFRHGYCKHNPRKMVKTWAEKEMRNLLRWDSFNLRSKNDLINSLNPLLVMQIGNALALIFGYAHFFAILVTEWGQLESDALHHYS